MSMKDHVPPAEGPPWDDEHRVKNIISALLIKPSATGLG